MKTAGLVRTTYEIITPESAEEGDAEERGWIDEEGQECTPEEAFKMVEGCEPSASDYTGGVWYTDNEYHTDFKTGAEESRSYHLKGFTPRQERLIFDSVEAGHWQGDEEDEALDAEEAAAPGENPNQLKLFESAVRLVAMAKQVLAEPEHEWCPQCGYDRACASCLSDDAEGTDKEAVAPPGFEKVVKELKKNPEVENPWAIAWSMKNKGDRPHRATAEKLLCAARTLLAADDYSEEELAALSIMGMNKPSYRAVEFERVGLGPYTKDSPVLKSLVAKGLVKFTATGIQLDKPLAVAVMKRHLAPEKYKGRLSNTSMQFKRKEEPGEEAEDTSPMDVSDGAAWDRAKGAATLIAMARQLLDGSTVDGHVAGMKTAAEGTIGSADFIELLRSKLSVGDRKVSFVNHGNQIFLNYINLPVKLSNGGAEAENNRIMLAITGFGKGENEPAPSGKVWVELVVCAVRDANQGRLRLRAKSGSPEQIAQYVADFLNMIAKDIPPNYTHTSPRKGQSL